MKTIDDILDEIPNKNTFKSTTTRKMKSDLYNLVVGGSHRCVLELGTNLGLSSLPIARACYEVGDSVLYSLDNSSECLYKSEKLLVDYELRDYVEFLQFDLYDENQDWSVLESLPVTFVFVDAVHDYESVLSDVTNIKRMYGDIDICMHDYGLTGYGVKPTIEKLGLSVKRFLGEENDWNPLGLPVDDWEGVLI